eukprot:1149923-Pelagomonas_calceolata.AAC.12
MALAGLKKSEDAGPRLRVLVAGPSAEPAAAASDKQHPWRHRQAAPLTALNTGGTGLAGAAKRPQPPPLLKRCNKLSEQMLLSSDARYYFAQKKSSGEHACKHSYKRKKQKMQQHVHQSPPGSAHPFHQSNHACKAQPSQGHGDFRLAAPHTFVNLCFLCILTEDMMIMTKCPLHRCGPHPGRHQRQRNKAAKARAGW